MIKTCKIQPYFHEQQLVFNLILIDKICIEYFWWNFENAIANQIAISTGGNHMVIQKLEYLIDIFNPFDDCCQIIHFVLSKIARQICLFFYHPTPPKIRNHGIKIKR